MGIQRDRELGDNRSRILRQAWLVLQSRSQGYKQCKDFCALFHEGLDEPARACQPQGAFQDLLGCRAFSLPDEPDGTQNKHTYKSEI